MSVFDHFNFYDAVEFCTHCSFLYNELFLIFFTNALDDTLKSNYFPL